MSDAKGYLGLELAGAKNQKTAIAVLEYYPKEKKIFLLDIYEKIVAEDHYTGDQTLLELINELKPGVAKIGVNVSLELPPCTTCTRKTCPLPSKCTVPAVQWMRSITRKAMKNDDIADRVKEFTPYTQRPIELWIRYQILPKLPDGFRFEVDETLGGNKAPLTARMHFLKRHIDDPPLIEALPKLSVAILATHLGLHKRTVSTYRHLEQGSHARSEILEALADKNGVFIYERDLRKLSNSLSAFDAFICAYTALLSDINQCTKIPSGFPATATSGGWVHYPQL